MDLPALVQAFNNLPRSPKTQSGLVDNHWQFAVHHVPREPPGDILHLVNPGSFYQHSEGPAQILSAPNVAARAEIVLPLLLRAFVNSMGLQNDPRVTPLAPWSWGTDSEELAKALEERLKEVGVRKELCVIKVGDAKLIELEQEEWSKIYGMVEKTIQVGPRCTKCKNAPAGNEKLQLCGGCKKAHYCSRGCQKEDWKEHKTICKYLSKDPSIDALEYYQKAAPIMPEAQELAREIGLTLGTQGLTAPIRRLVVTGKDSPENIAKFLGRGGREEIERTHKEIRIEVLLRPPPGSPMYVVATSLNLDENCPAWTPRAASAAEQAEVRKIRDMQGLIRSHMGSRSMSSITTRDMQAILTANFADTWVDEFPYYQTAINAMDQGVRVD